MTQAPPDLMDPLGIGLHDLVKSGWYGRNGELVTGFPIGPDDVVVDVGGGGGGTAGYCAQQGAQVVFTDVREDKVAQAEASLRERGLKVRGLVSDSAPLPLEDGFASRVICTEVLEHVDDPAVVLAELARIGRPGALYLISVPDPVGEDLLSRVAPPHYFRPPNHVRVFSHDGFKAAVEAAGLTIDAHRTEGFFWTFGLGLLWAIQPPGDAQGDIHEGLGKEGFPPALARWARLWWELLETPGFEPVREELNALAPKTQVIIARKPPTP